MSDYGTRYADRAGRVLEIRFQRTFTEAQSDLLKKLDEFTAKYQKKDKLMREKLDKGEIDKEKYDRWVAGQVFQGAQWEQKVRDIDETLLDYYSDAMDKVYDKQLDVFSKNANYQAYCMEHDVGKNFGFDIYSAETVERLVQDTPELLPRKIVNRKKHNHWNQGIINNCITQGVIQGESIPKIARRIANTVANTNMKSATMYARTAMTSAQNGGRMEMLKQAKGMGINVKKQWLAIIDKRTRDSHIHLDGQIRDVDKPFKSDYGRIDFPGDFKANPADVYNCRCTLVYVFPEYEDMSQYPDWEEAQKMTYPEWEEQKEGKTPTEKDDFGNPVGKFEVLTDDGRKITVSTRVVDDYEFPDGNWQGVHSKGKAYIYTLPDGTELHYKAGMDTSKQDLSPNQLIKALDKVPKEIREQGQKKIVVVDYRNPMDGYWARRYKWKGFRSYMNSGDGTDIWAWTHHDLAYVAEAIAHEDGHFIDRIHGTMSATKRWRSAKTADKKVSGRLSPKPYGEKNDLEDFAVSVEQFAVDPDFMEKNFPNRLAIIKELLGVRK